jgi:hypothetical protein
MVQLRLPVVAVVQNLITSSCFSINSNFVRLFKLEGSSTSDNMNVRRDLSRGHNRIATLNGERCAVDCEKRLCGFKERQASEGPDKVLDSHLVTLS